MIPLKKAVVRVEKLFPDFEADKPLRFSKIFGPGKYSSLPDVSKKVSRRRSRHEQELEEQDWGNDEGSLKEMEEEHEEILRASVAKQRDDYPGQDLTPDSEFCVQDEEEIYCKPSSAGPTDGESSESDAESKPQVPATSQAQVEQIQMKNEAKKLWRHGPASYWFDMLGVPDDAEDFDYGFKKKTKVISHGHSEKPGDSDEEEKSKTSMSEKPKMPDDCFHMVTQLQWENSIIWDGDAEKAKMLAASKTTDEAVLNLMNGLSRSAPRTSNVRKSPGTATASPGSSVMNLPNVVDDTWYSMFPVDTPELVSGAWEEDIIWDIEEMEKIPEPKVLELDPNDDNCVIFVPEDVNPHPRNKISQASKNATRRSYLLKKSKTLLGNAGIISGNGIEQDTPPPSPKIDDKNKDPYNLSQDEDYQPPNKSQMTSSLGFNLRLLHSTPALELRTPLMPTFLNINRLRQFHRTPLRNYGHGPLSIPGPHRVDLLTDYIEWMSEKRKEERQSNVGGDIFFMRTLDDLSAKDGNIVLVEYCEEFPPLLSQPGMCSIIKNYFKRSPGKESGPPELSLGETVYCHTSPFLGTMVPGQLIRALENNMYRVPIYRHEVNRTDFLVLRERNGYCIRELDHVFTAGQECPSLEVPNPKSKQAANFVRDFLQVFIYRMFWESNETPRRIRMDDVKKAFPDCSESNLRKRLKLCSDFRRTGNDSNWWVLKPDFRLPVEEELREFITPEQCCTYYSFLAAEQRLKDAGYGEQSIMGSVEEENEEDEKKLEDEVKAAPWNTTRAFIQARKGRCMLQVVGPADPTGCGEGFSYVRVPNKPQASAGDPKDPQSRKLVKGTDADLRRLSLNNAKALLRKFDVPEEEIRKLSRWEVIDVVRTLSTEKAKVGQDGQAINKYSRANPYSHAQYAERYKEECQRVFELQNRVLDSSEVLSTDEESSSDEDDDDNEDFEEMGKNIENILTHNKSNAQFFFEKEEAERLELQKMIMEEDQKDKDDPSNVNRKDQKKIDEENNNLAGLTSHPERVLKITRVFKDEDGNEYTRSELVRRSNIIDIYVRIRTTKPETFINKFTFQGDPGIDAKKKEKRRLQESIRRLKKTATASVMKKERTKKEQKMKKQRKVKAKPDLKVKCGACGNVGHMRTNKACPLFEGGDEEEEEDPDFVPPKIVAMTEDEEAARHKELVANGSDYLVQADGIKMHFSRKLVQHATETHRRSLVLKVPREAIKRKRPVSTEPCDYFESKTKTTNRMRVDPRVAMSCIFENVLNELKKAPDSVHFSAPVSVKIPNYYAIIKKPIDLRTMREKNRNHVYQSRRDFLKDMKRMAKNCTKYNGDNHFLTISAENMVVIAKATIKENVEKLKKLEQQLNPENDVHKNGEAPPSEAKNHDHDQQPPKKQAKLMKEVHRETLSETDDDADTDSE